jgi:hypothetical protein
VEAKERTEDKYPTNPLTRNIICTTCTSGTSNTSNCTDQPNRADMNPMMDTTRTNFILIKMEIKSLNCSNQYTYKQNITTYSSHTKDMHFKSKSRSSNHAKGTLIRLNQLTPILQLLGAKHVITQNITTLTHESQTQTRPKRSLVWIVDPHKPKTHLRQKAVGQVIHLSNHIPSSPRTKSLLSPLSQYKNRIMRKSRQLTMEDRYHHTVIHHDPMLEPKHVTIMR